MEPEEKEEKEETEETPTETQTDDAPEGAAASE